MDEVSKSIENIFGRLEEFQTILHFNQQDRADTIQIMASLLDHRDDLDDLFARIDSVENVVQTLKGVLAAAEHDLDRAEHDVAATTNTANNKMANLFTPLLFVRIILQSAVEAESGIVGGNI